jgi:hypothetical protein
VVQLPQRAPSFLTKSWLWASGLLGVVVSLAPRISAGFKSPEVHQYHMKHTVKLLNRVACSHSRSKYVYVIWDIEIDGIRMQLNHYGYIHKNTIRSRFRFSAEVIKHPDYKEIRKQVLSALNTNLMDTGCL